MQALGHHGSSDIIELLMHAWWLHGIDNPTLNIQYNWFRLAQGWLGLS